MIPILLRRKPRTRLPRNPVPKHGLTTLELAGLVIGVDPVGNLLVVSGLYNAIVSLLVSF